MQKILSTEFDNIASRLAHSIKQIKETKSPIWRVFEIKTAQNLIRDAQSAQLALEALPYKLSADQLAFKLTLPNISKAIDKEFSRLKFFLVDDEKAIDAVIKNGMTQIGYKILSTNNYNPEHKIILAFDIKHHATTNEKGNLIKSHSIVTMKAEDSASQYYLLRNFKLSQPSGVSKGHASANSLVRLHEILPDELNKLFLTRPKQHPKPSQA